MYHNESLFKPRYNGTPEDGFEHNKKIVARYRLKWEEAKQYNKQPVIISVDKETPLAREYPPIVPSIRKK